MEPTPSFDLAEQYQRHPYQTLLVAAGVGYVLGGGLFTSLTLNILRLGLRVAAIPIVRRELIVAAESVLGASPTRD